MAPVSTSDLLTQAARDQVYFVDFFIGLHLFSILAHTIMVLTTLFSKSVSRQGAWIAFSASWILFSTGSSILFFSGHLHNPKPPFNLCLTQAAFIYSTSPLTGATTLALVLQTWLNVEASLTKLRPHRFMSTLLIMIPALIFCTLMTACIVLGAMNPQIVQRTPDRFYCNFSNRIPSRISAVTVAAFMITAIVFVGLICYRLRKHWPVFRVRARGPGTLSGIIRVIAFALCAFLATSLGVIFLLTNERGPLQNIALASGPFLAAIIFGSRKDMLNVWMFWRKKDTSDATLVGQASDAESKEIDAESRNFPPKLASQA